MIKFFFKLIKEHKIIAGIIIVVILAGGYYGYTNLKGNSNTTSYVLAKVQKGTLIVSISGSGQVSALNQIDIKPKVSSELTYVGVANDQSVKAGAVIAQLNAQDAQKTVRDAQANLDSAKLSLEKLQQPADALSLLQAENALAQANQSKQSAQDSLKKAYDDGFNDVASAFLDLPTVMNGLESILFSNDLAKGQDNIDYYADGIKLYDEVNASRFRDAAFNAYQKANQEYNQNFTDYKSASRYSDTATIENLVSETYETTKTIADAVKGTNDLIQLYQDKLIKRNLTPPSISSTHLSNLSSYVAKTNTHVSTLLSAKSTIQDDKDAIVNADRSIAEKTESLANLKAGADALDIQSAQLTIQQRQNAILDAQEKLADYTIRAPFDGAIVDLNAQKGDSVSSATIIATLITTQKIAEISLNEVDVAKVKVGQKATLTFDAVPDLSITGQVAQVDAIGTVSQGVVTYNVKIVFDTQDQRIKSSMSVTAAIITDVRQDVLLVSNSTIKQQNSTSYVETPNSLDLASLTDSNITSSSGIALKNLPVRQTVETGISNDQYTEVTSGLKEGDVVVTSTTGSQTTTTQQQTSTFRLPGLGGGGRD